MLKIKNLVLFTIIVGLLFNCDRILNCNNCIDNNDYSAESDFSFTIDVDDYGALEIVSINGNIEIEGTTNDSTISVWGKRIVKSDSQNDANDHLEDLQVEWFTSNERIIVETDQPEDTHGRQYEVQYHVELPIGFDIHLYNVNGNASVDSMESTANINLTNGNVVVVDLIGDLAIDLTNGNIYSECHYGNSDISLTNGNVSHDTDLPSEGECEIDVTNGNIDLEIPTSTSAEFSAKIINGSISTQNLTFSNYEKGKKYVTGRLGEGNGDVDLKTTNGNIKVVGN